MPARANPGLILHTSNRLETLADRLASLLRAEPAPPLSSEVVIVQSQGMARWLQLELARRLGLCAQVRFPFPRAFAREVFRAFDPSVQDISPTDPEHLTWRIWSLLPELREDPHGHGEAVQRYLHEDPDGRKRYQLASRIARLFDDYAIFRPEMVLDWDRGEDRSNGDSAIGGGRPMETMHPWQARLWRKLRDITRDDHPAARWHRFTTQIGRVAEPPAGLPPRVVLFGISALPPFYVDLFDRLGQWSAVHVFLLQPSAEYWGDLPSAKAALRRPHKTSDGVGGLDAAPAALGPGGSPGFSALHQHEGNTLLASLGGQGRDFLNVLLATTDFNNLDEFQSPGHDSLLHSIQSDILELRNRGASFERRPIQSHDDSILVHSCHSPLRELEVLQDHILHWLSQDPQLTPRDILVLTPDIETYGPLVEAVFAPAGLENGGRLPQENPGSVPPSTVIPFSVADRSAGSQSQILGAFQRLLNLAGGRLGAASVLELLETPAVRRRFELTQAEVARARDWLREAGVRWGRDEAHRAALGLPAFRQHTWADGLDRLLLGYAMSAEDGQLFDGLLPCAGPEGQASAILGHILEFTEHVFATFRTLEQSHSLSGWVAVLRRLMADSFAGNEDDEAELRWLREIIAELEAQANLAQIPEPFPLPVLLEHLAPLLEDDRWRGGFLTGRVTFGALKPMRSIPFKVICLLGLNDAAFPRADVRLGFDLMAARPRLGDQSKREDDRYLFLETLLSARDRLYLSYVGQSVRDNSPAPPSGLVSELLDYIDQGYVRLAPPSLGPASSASSAAPGYGQPTAAHATDLAPLARPGALVAPLRPRGARRSRIPENQLSLELFAPAAPERPEPAPAPVPAAEPATCRMMFKHRLQAFSPDYFTPSKPLFSHSAENLRACLALRQPPAPTAFLRQPIPDPDDTWRTVDLDLLAEFFVNPARFFLSRRLDVRLPKLIAELSEREPMELAGLDYFTLKSDLLECRLDGHDLAALRPAVLAGGQLPPGRFGELRYAELCDEVEEFCLRLNRYRPNEHIETPELDLAIDAFRVVGRFPRVTSLAVLYYRAATIGPKDRIRTWVRHLAWSATLPPGGPPHSVIVGEPTRGRSSAGLRYDAVERRRARELLGKLLAHYWRGLSEPLRFFPKTSLKFAEIDYQNADRRPDAWKDSLKKARQEWESDRFKDGEEDDDYFKICFHDFDPLDGDFRQLARQIGEPLLEHEKNA